MPPRFKLHLIFSLHILSLRHEPPMPPTASFGHMPPNTFWPPAQHPLAGLKKQLLRENLN